MPSRSSVTEVVQIGVETTPGTAVPPTRRLGSLGIEFSAEVDVKTFSPNGYKLATVASLARDWTSGKISGIPTYTELPYALCGIFNKVASTTPGGATLTRRWTTSMNTSSADTPATYTVESGAESQRAQRAAGLMITEYGITYSKKNGLSHQGSVLGRKLADDKVRYIRITGAPTGGTFTITVGANTTSGIAFNATAATIQSAVAALASVGTGNVAVGTGTAGADFFMLFGGTLDASEIPTVTASGASLTGGSTPSVAISRLSGAASELTLLPLLATDIDIYVATSQAGLAGATKLQQALEFSWKMGNRFSPVWNLDSSNASWGDYVEAQPSTEASLKVGANAEGMGFLRNLRAGSTVFVRALATSPTLIETGFPFKSTTDLAMKITKISPLGDDDGLVNVMFSGEIAHDPTWTKGIETVTDTTLASL